MNNTLSIILQVIANLAIILPLIISLVKYVKEAIQEKNWKKMLDMVLALVAEAEDKFESGAEKKEWVIGMLKSASNVVNYDFNDEELGKLIDNVVATTKKVNTK